MDLWYNELHTPNVRFSIKVERQLYSAESRYQRIDVFESPEFGRFLTLDGFIMLTEKDEFIYHEMITHVPMAVKPDARRVLVVGAGDGGVARELARYPAIESIEVAEIDRQVVDVCREYLPRTAVGFDDPRVTVHYQDGMRFIRKFEDAFDLIIVDSTDPTGPGESLFTKEFYGSCHKALKADGIMVNQHESPFYPDDAAAMARAHKRIRSTFAVSRVYQAHIPTYPSGHWLFGFASKGADPVRDLDAERWNALGITTRYYSVSLHAGAFCLPRYVEEMLDNAVNAV
ncbi:MAG: polyamine aminopropyltransferase [Clostridiales bacterium]|jgi:spermidine synthase|nr:polyamine aminopropyltransferase [Clostridiales bacterium]